MSFPDSPHLTTGSGTQVGVITLWTKKEQVLTHIPEDLYAVGSQLYSRDEGVSMLMRSLLSHKEIRDLVLTGADLNGCADALIALFEHGVSNGQVIGAPGYVDPEIPSEAINRVREHVTLHDKRKENPRKLADFIRAIPQKGSWGQPEEFPPAKLQTPDIFPFGFQHTLRHSEVSQAAFELASRQRRLGDLRNLQLQVTARAEVPEWLKQTDYASLFDILTSDDDFVHAVCDSCSLQQLLCFVCHTATKDDVVYTFTVSTLTCDALTNSLKEYSVSRRVTGDPASNVLIRLRDGAIQVTHLAPDGRRLEQFSSTSGEELYRKLIEEFRIADMGHAGYVGYELGKAEFALKNGEWYEQDLPLFFKEQDS